MTGKRKEPRNSRRSPSEFVRRAAGHGEDRMAVPHASLKRRAMGLMRQPLRTDLFRPAALPHEVEEVFISRNWNFVEGTAADVPPPNPAPAPAPARAPAAAKKVPSPEEDRIEPDIGLEADEEPALEDADLELPPAVPPAHRPLEAGETLDLPDLDEYDGSDMFDADDPDETAEPAIPTEERTELPSALRNRRNYYENSDEARKGGLLGGIIPGGGRAAPKSGSRPKRR